MLKKTGLYDPSFEKDACGVGFVVDINGISSKKVLDDAKTMLIRMSHRGAICGDDTGDGAGVLTNIPHQLYHTFAKERGVTLPPRNHLAVGMIFLDRAKTDEIMSEFQTIAESLDIRFLFWKFAEINDKVVGAVAKSNEPGIVQVFLSSTAFDESDVHSTLNSTAFSYDDYKRKIYLLRKYSTHSLQKKCRFYICSLSTETVVYKGQFTPSQLWEYYVDLKSEEFRTNLAIVHSRFSTNTFPSWERAHPNRMLAHNGEINTLRGNVNYMSAREGVMKSEYYTEENFTKLYPVIEPDMSDSGCFDNVLEFLYYAGGRALPEVMMNMVPEAWQNDLQMSNERRDYFAWAAHSLEPWDGPALLTFSDGRYIGAILDRNGLRPSRYYLTDENIMYMSSEVGVADLLDEKVVKKGRLKAGRMLLVDTLTKQFMNDEALKMEIALHRPVSEWLKESFTLEDLKSTLSEEEWSQVKQDKLNEITRVEDDRRLFLHGYTMETLHLLILPMLNDKKEALGSMGNDASLACLSATNPLLFDYFKQNFAQVTNPPIDPFREKIVMSLACPVGPEANILIPSKEQCSRLWLKQPIISIPDMWAIKYGRRPGWKCSTISICYSLDEAINHPSIALQDALEHVCSEAEKAVVQQKCKFLVLSDREAGIDKLPIPSLMALGAVHQHFLAHKLRMKCAIFVECGDAREVHHFCTLIGYGADGVCPYLVFEAAAELRKSGLLSLSDEDMFNAYVTAVETGLYKVMAKMGISTLHSYKGAQIFEALGLANDVMEKCFRGTSSRVGGISFDCLCRESLSRHRYAFYKDGGDMTVVYNPGYYHWRQGGEKHMNDPLTIASLQDAAINANQKAYETFAQSANLSTSQCTLRGQLEFVERTPVSIDLVEPASEIVKRFCTGAMSFGSISYETHTTLAIAMNRVGARSNTGEGGETPERYLNVDKDNNTRSAIKQVASARFGVNSSYLAHADELQIKMAQGAKPGEGGELPGHKVTVDIAKTRHSVPGVGLISPPPHHDIYSIEDLAQLIYDLKSANPKARISVKLVSEVGVGVIASGVVKGMAEHLTISGHDGGTGASSWTGIKHAGLPWELGIAETHQTLILNGLRSKVVLQADGQIRTGRDIVTAALLGADEIGMSTAPLIALGCIMMRKCHLNTCPVGVATQDPELRRKFTGQPEHVINYLFYLAEDVRSIMSKLGVTKFQELVGQADWLRPKTVNTLMNGDEHQIRNKADLLDFSALIKNFNILAGDHAIVGGSVAHDFRLDTRLDQEIIQLSRHVIDGHEKSIDIHKRIINDDRSFGSTLSYEISIRHAEKGLPDNSINIYLNGHAGQSFCAFLAHGVSIRLEGDANDYVGKGLSGGKVCIVPPKNTPSNFRSEDNIIIGNVCLYGAIQGTLYARGQAAERFCVRNSGALAIVEGVGDHGCEYMTGGRVIILGLTGRNFAAGMSGGIAYVYDNIENFTKKCNLDMVQLEVPTKHVIDAEFLRKHLEDFVKETGSEVAQSILKKWPESLKNFVKVFPIDYRRALKEQALVAAEAILKEEHEKVHQSSKTDSKEESVNGIDEIHENRNGVHDIEDSIPDPVRETATLDKLRGFMKYSRAKNQYRPVKVRMNDWNEIYAHKAVRSTLRTQAARCMECGVPFCQSHAGCPLGNIIPRWNDFVYQDKWKDALIQLLQTNNFPEFTGRCCPAPCEAACVLGINQPAVTIKNIECAIIDEAFSRGWIVPEPPAHRTGKRICVVGSGPSGLAAASQLNKAGHWVVVLERNDRIGGLLRYGIPTMKMDKDVVQRRIDLMQQEGIEFHTKVHVGRDEKFTEEKLVRDFDAVVLCTGATWPRDLPIPGRHLNGIHFAMSFLEKWQRHQHEPNNMDYLQTYAKDKHVLVLGGGDTGNDCIATSLRQGAASIITFEILPIPPVSRDKVVNPWPTWPRVWKMDYGHEEVQLKWGNDPRKFSIVSKEFLDDGNGNVAGVRTVLVDWIKKPETGQWSMVEMPGTEEVYPCDLVLLALGFLGPESDAISLLGVQKDSRSNITTSSGQYNASRAKVYAAGDCRRGQSLVVHAINEGRQAARQVDLDLMGRTALAGPGGVVDVRVEVLVGAS